MNERERRHMKPNRDTGYRIQYIAEKNMDMVSSSRSIPHDTVTCLKN